MDLWCSFLARVLSKATASEGRACFMAERWDEIPISAHGEEIGDPCGEFDRGLQLLVESVTRLVGWISGGHPG